MAFSYKLVLGGLLALRGVHAECGTVSGNSLAAELFYYSDDQCTEKLTTYDECYYVTDTGGTFSPGQYVCADAGLSEPSNQNVYAKMVYGYDSNTQVLFTANQACPPEGPGDVDAVVSSGNGCVQVSVATSSAGVTIYPDGGGPLPGPKNPTNETQTPSMSRNKRASRIQSNRRSQQSCTGFSVTKSTPTTTESKPISPILDCVGQSTDCPITLSMSMSETETTSFSTTAGVSVFGVSVSTTFGQSYSDTETTGISATLSVPAGQKGYATAYCAATLFSGSFTGCSGDDSTIQGSVFALKADGFTYEEVNTSTY